MEREILTHQIERIQVQRELEFMVAYFQNRGFSVCKVLFGFAWGMEYYPGSEWSEEKILLGHLVEKVGEVEIRGIGALGRDDLFVEVSDLKFQFCHDSDVHIHFDKSCSEIEFFYSRWKQLGYQPSEWLKNEENGPGKRVRFN